MRVGSIILALFILSTGPCFGNNLQSLIGDRQVNITARCEIWGSFPVTLSINEYGNLVYFNRTAKFEIFNGKSDEPEGGRIVEVILKGDTIAITDSISDSGGAAFLTSVRISGNTCTATYEHETGNLSFGEMDPVCKAVRCVMRPRPQNPKKR